MKFFKYLIALSIVFSYSGTSFADSKCAETLETIPESSPVFHMLSAICKAVVSIVANSSSPSTEPARDERLVLITAIKNEIIVTTEKIAGEMNFTVLEIPDMPGGIFIDYDPIEEFMYWTWRGFHRARLDGKDYEKVLNATDTYEGLAIDWVARHLYWTEDTNKIKVSRMDGSIQKTLVNESLLDKPRGFALDPSRGKMYWSEWGDNKRIASAWMNGKNVKTLVDTDIVWPNGIALDMDRDVIYWNDAKLDTISAVNTDGTQRKVILSLGPGNTHAFGISYLDNHVYWTDWMTKNLESLNLNATEKESILHSAGRPMNGLKATKLYPPPGITNECGESNGGCSHLCLYTPEGPTCSCADDWSIDDSDRCTETD